MNCVDCTQPYFRVSVFLFGMWLVTIILLELKTRRIKKLTQPSKSV